MFGHIILVVLQFFAAWFSAPMMMAYLPIESLDGNAQTFVHAALYASAVTLVGAMACFALKEVRMPTLRTFAAALVGALFGAGLMFLPQLLAAIPFKFPPLYLPLFGAIIGYLVRR